MRHEVLHERLRVDANHRLHIDIPDDMGDEFDVIVLPILVTEECAELDDEDNLNLAVFAATTPDDPEEDAIWENYLNV
ncbi:MAG: hypothetical protein WCI11_10620 [Candidatus Methylumidiphilus sp.]